MKQLIIVAAILCISTPVLAQQGSGKSMYRCGNNYQDRPCDGGGPGAAKAASPAPAAPSPAPAAKAAPAAAVKAAAVPAAPPAEAAKAPVMTKAQQQRQIRCENFGRQLDELRDRQKAAPQQAESVGVQIKSLQSRMSVDNCS